MILKEMALKFAFMYNVKYRKYSILYTHVQFFSAIWFFRIYSDRKTSIKL